jgi:hypothetical protein
VRIYSDMRLANFLFALILPLLPAAALAAELDEVTLEVIDSRASSVEDVMRNIEIPQYDRKAGGESESRQPMPAARSRGETEMHGNQRHDSAAGAHEESRHGAEDSHDEAVEDARDEAAGEIEDAHDQAANDHEDSHEDATDSIEEVEPEVPDVSEDTQSPEVPEDTQAPETPELPELPEAPED